MFGRKRITTIEHIHRVELSDEMRQALVSLESDLQVLQQFQKEVIDQGHRILGALHAEVTQAVPPESIERVVTVEGAPLPREMHGRPPGRLAVSDDDRIRATPFTRAPRHVQVEWLMGVLADGEWHTAVQIAREYANDHGHFRYLRAQCGHRMRELHEEGLLMRQHSSVQGAMFEYRVRA